jgi:hypothetical protein
LRQGEAPANPIDITQLQLPQNYQIYKRTDEQEEQFLLGDSGIYVVEGRHQR